MSRPTPSHHPGEQGSAMLVVSTILIALLAGGGIALFLQLQSTRSTALTKSGRESLYCAEAGLAAGQAILTNQYSLWSTMLDADSTNDPPWYPIVGDIDQDGVNDYEVSIKDNDDEVAPALNAPAADVDSRVYMISRCLQNPEVPRNVMQLIDVKASGVNYSAQDKGGAGATSNMNR